MRVKTFYRYDAADSENLIDQYEPRYIYGLAGVVSGFTRVEYSQGFNYTVTSVNCTCPIEPPTNVATP